MREHRLQPWRRKRFVATTDSAHPLPVFPNLARDVVPDGPNQLWTGDLTYVAVAAGFVYVALILDAWSRRVVGYAISRRIDARLAVAALQAAIDSRRPALGCICHSDRGAQYASARYREVLAQHGLIGSMSRRGNPYDNATAESFIKTLKVEAVYLMDYHTFEDVGAHLPIFLEQVYNTRRLHSALVWCPLNTRRMMIASSSSRRPSSCRADAHFPLWFSLTINANRWSPSPSPPQCRTAWFSGPASSWPVRRA